MRHLTKAGAVFLVLGFFFFSIAVSQPSSQAEEFIREADILFQANYEKESLEKSIALYEQALLLDQNNAYLLNRLSEAYYILAFAHLYVFVDDPEQTRQERLVYYSRGFEYGERSLKLNPSFSVWQERDFAKALSFINDIAGLHWTSVNWGKVLELQGISFRARQDLPKLKAILERAVQLDEQYLYAGPLRAIAYYWAGLPWWWGQDLKKARYFFEKAIVSFPNFLTNLAIFAQEYAVRVRDCPLLNEIVKQFEVASQAEFSLLPEHLIWNIVAGIGIEKLIENNQGWCAFE